MKRLTIFYCVIILITLSFLANSCTKSSDSPQADSSLSLNARSCDSATVVQAILSDTKLVDFHQAFNDMKYLAAYDMPDRDSIDAILSQYDNMDFCANNQYELFSGIDNAVEYFKGICLVNELFEYFYTEYPCIEYVSTAARKKAFFSSSPQVIIDPNEVNN